MIEDRRAYQILIIGKDDQADQVVGTALHEARKRLLRGFQPSDPPRAMVRWKIDRVHARAIVNGDDDRHSLPGDSGHPADRLRTCQPINHAADGESTQQSG